jgi:antitoxin VapB
MPLSIKDEETDQLARAVSAATGETITEAVRNALRARLDSLTRQENRNAKIEAMRRIGRDVGAHMRPPLSCTDHGELLYDEHGLPK